MRQMILLFLFAAVAAAGAPGVIVSVYSKADFELTADPAAPQWKGVPAVIADSDQYGKPVAGHRTEIRSRWTEKNIYFLYVCPYERLFLRPNPSTSTETNKLWEWDVAEVFVGADFKNIRQYKEFQVSPQGEWVDLDIDRDHPKPEGGWLWNSGFRVKARLEADRNVWYGEMRIPLAAIDQRQPEQGNQMRINFYRMQGTAPRRNIAWQPTNAPSYHVPEAFGRLVLGK